MSANLLRLRDALNVALEREPRGVSLWPLKLTNPLNGGGLGVSRGARMAGNAERKTQRRVGRALTLKATNSWDRQNAAGWVVLLTRVSPKKFDDDNLAASLKSVRDGIAEALGVDDGGDEVVWLCDWRKGEAHEVEVKLWLR